MFDHSDNNQQNDQGAYAQDNPSGSPYSPPAPSQDSNTPSYTSSDPLMTNTQDYSPPAVDQVPAVSPTPPQNATYDDSSDDFVPPSAANPAGATATPVAIDNDLLELKQKALQDLTPLVSKLDQTPDEKFRTTMMMIQASDNKALLPDAYTAAQAIPDEKMRAQALLDVINEINYFTQAS
jgi:hypothetical protein